jgi:sugar phosphate permease
MNAKLNFASPSSTVTVASATMATVIAMGILWAVVALFQSRGAPMERLAAAERACAQHAYQSERAACMNEWLAASQPRTIARR